MAEPPPSELEQMAQAAPQNVSQPGQKQQEQKKPETPLEEIVNAAKNTAAFAVGAVGPYVWPFGTGINNAVTAWPLALGSAIEDKMQGKPINWVKGAKESVVEAIINRPLEKLFENVNNVRDYVTTNHGLIPGFGAAAAALGLGQAVFIGMYTGLNHVIQNHTFKGLGEKFKKEYWPSVKRTWMYVLPLSALNVTILPYTAIYKTLGITAQLAYGSLMTLLFRLVGPKAEGTSLKNLFKELNPFPYVGAALSVTAKAAKNILYQPFNALYDVGKALGGYGSSPVPSAPETSVPAPSRPAPAH